MRPLTLQLVQALLAFANPTYTADTGAGAVSGSSSQAVSRGGSCPAGDGGQTPFIIRLGLVHPRCLPEEAPAAYDGFDSFESFEEWKARQAAEQVRKPAAAIDNRTHSTNSSANNESAVSETNANVDAANTPPPPPLATGKKANRYNYASPDCSARVLSSSPQTQHASSLLHKSKDRYMLTPCKANEHYVIVELCDEIRISAIEIAVWEFFSGVVRTVRLSVGGEENEEWKPVGEWIGKNVRGVQTFTLPEPTSFHRFVRLDFPSYYGTEYYCPVSQLKVYGLNQMEAFKMEQQRSAEATRDEAAEQAERERQLAQQEEERLESERRAAEAKEREEEHKREQELCELEKLVQAQARRGRELDYEEIIQCAPLSAASSSSAAPVATGSVNPIAGGEGAVAPSAPNASLSASSGGPQPTVAVGPPAPPMENGSASSAAPLPSALKRDSSESIYAHIVRRLSALEGNGTLVARYIDEQARALRAAVSRLEAVQTTLLAARSDAERANAGTDARLLRLSTQVEYLRLTSERDRHAAQAQLRALADELGFERRKSVAQLVILIGIVALALFSKSATIENLLRPLERTGKKHGHGKKLSSGPLAGLVIDVATPRPFSQDGKGWDDRPKGWEDRPSSPLSPSQPRRRKGSRPTTPTLANLKRRALAQRSLSMIHGEEEVAPPRSKLRSAHLHPLRRADDDPPAYRSPLSPTGRSPLSPTARSPLRSPGFPGLKLGTPPKAMMTPTPRRRRFPTEGAEDDQWDTSANGASTSASERERSDRSEGNEMASASEASNELASEDEYNGIGGVHPRNPRDPTFGDPAGGGSFST